MQYNPYDLVPLIINNKQTYGRPVTFDSDIIDQMTMMNAFGAYVKPTQISSTCPDCGQGFILDIKLSDPPFDFYVCSCPICKPTPPPLPDPFINPVTSERISINELDPMLHDIAKPVIPAAATTVAERIKKPKKKKVEKQHQIIQNDQNSFINYQDQPRIILEPAEGMEGDEINFNDNDLVES